MVPKFLTIKAIIGITWSQQFAFSLLAQHNLLFHDDASGHYTAGNIPISASNADRQP